MGDGGEDVVTVAGRHGGGGRAHRDDGAAVESDLGVADPVVGPVVLELSVHAVERAGPGEGEALAAGQLVVGEALGGAVGEVGEGGRGAAGVAVAEGRGQGGGVSQVVRGVNVYAGDVG